MKRLTFVLPVIAGLLLASPAITETWQTRPSFPISHGPFYLESYNGKCLTYGNGLVEVEIGDPSPPPPTPGTEIYMAECADRSDWLPGQLLLQGIVVKELNANHEVFLQAGSKVVGVMSNVLLGGVRLELQDYTGAAGQIWVLDGDSLILKADRSLIAEVKDGRTPAGTAVVLGARDLDDAEFWRFRAVDGTKKKPTNGFVTVSTPAAFRSALQASSWGTVIEIGSNAIIPLDGDVLGNFPVQVKAGVTIRGDRRGTKLGPELTLDSYPSRNAIEIVGNYARITGLRVRGPSRTKDQRPYSNGIYVDDSLVRWPIVDHNDMSGWTEAAVHVNYYSSYNPDTDLHCDPSQPLRPRTVRIVRNFLHHNPADELGYGVTIHSNGFADILGNTFLYNRHAIAGDGIRGTGYRALYNLVLSDAPEYGTWGVTEHDFDMHGSDDGDHVGGIAGSDVEIARNTFLGTDPGGPMSGATTRFAASPAAIHQFRNNVTRQGQSDAIHWYGQSSPTAPPPLWLTIANNRFNASNPTDRLGVGDFDGDGRQDLFLATGAAWYYAPAGMAEWRYLNAQPIAFADLLFGDVDGDGRTDVVTKQDGNWYVSWAGASKREKINESDGVIGDFALGDFNGDRRADIFYTDGTQWLISDGATAPFYPLGAPSPYRLADLRLGDFNGDGRTDVFAVIGENWFVRYSGNSFWSLLGPALTTSVANLLIADFDGNGRSDVALSNSSNWKVSVDGIGPWTPLRSSNTITLANAAAIGRFRGTPGADVLAWEFLPILVAASEYLDRVPSGSADPQRYSRDHMR